MNWTTAALLSAGILAIVNVVDSHLLSRRMPSLGSFLLPAGLCHLFYGTVLFFIFPFPKSIEAYPLTVAVVSGILRGAAVTIMLYIMTKEEISQVVPIVHTYPIFVAIMAFVLLGESLAYQQWLAIIVVVAGAVLVSLNRSRSGGRFWLSCSFGLLLLSGLMLAGADITSKYALDYFSSWNMYCLSVLCMSSLFFAVSLRGSILQELRSMPRLRSAIAIIAANETLAPIGITLAFLAIEQGKVSLASTIASSRPFFVFIYAIVLSRVSPAFLNWRPTGGALLLRFVATAMIVVGIAAIHLL
ncbi:EamA family transporter [Chloroflexota bacterium]